MISTKKHDGEKEIGNQVRLKHLVHVKFNNQGNSRYSIQNGVKKILKIQIN